MCLMCGFSLFDPCFLFAGCESLSSCGSICCSIVFTWFFKLYMQSICGNVASSLSVGFHQWYPKVFDIHPWGFVAFHCVISWSNHWFWHHNPPFGNMRGKCVHFLRSCHIILSMQATIGPQEYQLVFCWSQHSTYRFIGVLLWSIAYCRLWSGSGVTGYYLLSNVCKNCP